MKRIIRAKSGGIKKVDLTPIKAIRAFCLECVGHQAGAVRTCEDELCPLWPYRMGNDPGRERAEARGLVPPAEPSGSDLDRPREEKAPQERSQDQAGLFE